MDINSCFPITQRISREIEETLPQPVASLKEIVFKAGKLAALTLTLLGNFLLEALKAPFHKEQNPPATNPFLGQNLSREPLFYSKLGSAPDLPPQYVPVKLAYIPTQEAASPFAPMA